MALTLPKTLLKYSIGTGDRFGMQARAQLRAIAQVENYLESRLAIVWNKSNREHQICGTTPQDVREEADAAINALGWGGPYFVDADHVGMKNVDPFIGPSDFFTIDVADYIVRDGHHSGIDGGIAKKFARTIRALNGISIDGIGQIKLEDGEITKIAVKYSMAVAEAAKVYRHIANKKGAANFVTEVSMDETDNPQSPIELLCILAALSVEHVPAQTIAPKFTGRFNKGVDYVGDVSQFAREFDADLAVAAYAAREFGLTGLKLSVHSGSDKFSLYPIMNEAMANHGAGLHLKTAGTTWLAELEGLIDMGSHALRLVKDMYPLALKRYDELCGPYKSVIDIDFRKLPNPETVEGWTKTQFLAALENDPSNPEYNPSLRQLLHVAYKIAAEPRFRAEYLKRVSCEEVGQRVTKNLYEKHLKPLFVGGMKNGRI